MSVRIKLAVLTAIIAGSVSTVLPAAPATAAGVWMVNEVADRCTYAGSSSGSTVNASYTCDEWVLEWRRQDPGGPGIYRVRKDGTNLCVVVRGPDNEARAVLSACGHWNDQHWAQRWYTVDGWSRFQLINQSSGKCLTSRYDEPLPDPVIQFTCALDGRWNDQLWHTY